MTTATTTLADWLLLQLDADEAVARAATEGPWVRDVGVLISNPGPNAKYVADCFDEPDGSARDATHIARHDPARVLREVESKRRIVSRCDMVLRGLEAGMFDEGRAQDARDALRALASVYAGAPGWREEWAL